MGFFWGSIWLFWLIEPLVTAWRKGSLVGVLAIFAFAGTYLWHFYLRGWVFSGIVRRPRALARSQPAAAARYAVMIALAVLAIVTIGQDGAATLVFTGIATMWTFPVRPAFIVAIATGATYIYLWQHLPGWSSDYGSLVGMGLGVVAVMAGRSSAQRQRALSVSRAENAELAVIAERNRMARDLHDILGHSLTVITVKSELAGRLLEAGAVDKAQAEVADLERLSRDALADVRRAVEGYREISLSGELARARDALAAAGIRAILPSTTDDVSGDKRELFAWLIREGVTNVIRHSGAATCRIEVGADRASVSDDGGGSTGAAGNGLRGLRERADAAGLAVTTSSSPGGFTIAVTERHTKEPV